MSDQVSEDNLFHTMTVALTLAIVCGILVSVVSVSLHPLQQANVEAERIAKLELVLQALDDIGQAHTLENLEARIVELSSGEFDPGQNLDTFNAERAASTAGSSVVIPGDADVAGIKRRAKHARVYLVRDSSRKIEMIILPVSGRGYQSTLHAWLVLDGDGKTVRALKFYQHGETPGVGARIEEPGWEAKWQGASIYDKQGVLRIGVKSTKSSSTLGSSYLIDGISGATRTTQGVDGLIRFWLGDYGFAPFLQRLREQAL